MVGQGVGVVRTPQRPTTQTPSVCRTQPGVRHPAWGQEGTMLGGTGESGLRVVFRGLALAQKRMASRLCLGKPAKSREPQICGGPRSSDTRTHSVGQIIVAAVSERRRTNHPTLLLTVSIRQKTMGGVIFLALRCGFSHFLYIVQKQFAR